MRRSALIWPVLVAVVLAVSGCPSGRHAGPPPITVTAAVKPPPSGGGRGTVVLRVKTSPGWDVVISEDHPLYVKVLAPEGIVFSPAQPSGPYSHLPKPPGAFYAIPSTSDPLKVLVHYQVLDARALPADVTLSICYTEYAPDNDQGQFGYEDLAVTIPK